MEVPFVDQEKRCRFCPLLNREWTACILSINSFGSGREPKMAPLRFFLGDILALAGRCSRGQSRECCPSASRG